jgi:hypothetical protein
MMAQEEQAVEEEDAYSLTLHAFINRKIEITLQIQSIEQHQTNVRQQHFDKNSAERYAFNVSDKNFIRFRTSDVAGKSDVLDNDAFRRQRFHTFDVSLVSFAMVLSSLTDGNLKWQR